MTGQGVPSELGQNGSANADLVVALCCYASFLGTAGRDLCQVLDGLARGRQMAWPGRACSRAIARDAQRHDTSTQAGLYTHKRKRFCSAQHSI